MKFKKSAKTWKNEKMQHPNECFKSIKHFKSNFQSFESFLVCFERKWQKTCFLCDFLKNNDFGKKKKINITIVIFIKFLSKDVSID